MDSLFRDAHSRLSDDALASLRLSLSRVRPSSRSVGIVPCCANLYRMSDPPERRPLSSFDIDMAALIAERGAVVGLARCRAHTAARATPRAASARRRTATPHAGGALSSPSITLRDDPHAKRDYPAVLC